MAERNRRRDQVIHPGELVIEEIKDGAEDKLYEAHF
jgi:hypothetical protein